VAVAVLTGLVVAGVQPATATEIVCDSGFGTKVPVLMVHGLNSSAGTWVEGGALSMRSALEKVDGIRVTSAFDYNNVHNEWVTNKDIGPKLADTIDCLSQASRKSGGAGKVVVVAHSMGGLAARYAANQVVNGRRIVDELGLVITMGTPHLGSNYGNDCAWASWAKFNIPDCKGSAPTALAVGSNELRELPRFPDNVPVKAIAGNVFIRASFFFTHIDHDMGGDLVVGVDSATNEFTNAGHDGGKTVIKCFGQSAIAGRSKASCDHTVMVQSSDFQSEVKRSIEEYLASTRASVVPATNFFGLGLRLGPEWEVLKTADDPYVSSRRVVVSKAKCGPQTDPRIYCGGFVVANMRAAEPKLPYKTGTACNYDQIHDDLGWSPPKVVGKITVGGVEGEHFTQQNVCKLEDNGPISRRGDVLHGWRFPSKGVVVYDSEGTDHFSANPYPGIEQLLNNATWKG
jgi:pimeloyl-ACP methyl ester carboxylesterase